MDGDDGIPYSIPTNNAIIGNINIVNSGNIFSDCKVAIHVGCKVAPVAHNSGELWPRRAFIKKPGIVTISIGPAFDATGMSKAEVNERVESWIEGEMHRISPHRYRDAKTSAG